MTPHPSCVHYARYSAPKFKEQHERELLKVRVDHAASAEARLAHDSDRSAI